MSLFRVLAKLFVILGPQCSWILYHNSDNQELFELQYFKMIPRYPQYIFNTSNVTLQSVYIFNTCKYLKDRHYAITKWYLYLLIRMNLQMPICTFTLLIYFFFSSCFFDEFLLCANRTYILVLKSRGMVLKSNVHVF